MAITTTPFLSEDSLLAWQIESTRGTLPSTGSAWREFGRVNEWASLGPRNAITRDHVAGSGQEPHEIVAEGITYGGTIGPFQVRDPLLLGFAFGKETSRSGDLGGGFYRHTLAPTDAGQLPSLAVGQIDQRLDGSGVIDALAYLETVLPRFSLRGEAVNPDGSGGRLVSAVDLMPHDHTTSGASAITATPSSTTPYRFSHGKITLEGQQVFRIQEFEFTTDRRAQYAYYWQDVDADKPAEATPEGAIHDLNFSAVADGDVYTGASSKTLEGLLRDRTKFDMKFLFTRTASQDEFALNLTDVMIEDNVKQRGQGKVVASVTAPLRAATMEYVDANNSAFFPT